MISPAKQVFKCFVCNTGGNAIRFVQLYEKKSYVEAAIKIAHTVNFKHEFFERPVYERKVDAKIEPLVKAINDLTAYYQYNLLTKDGAHAKSYLTKRGLNEFDFQKYKIGFAPVDGRATIKFLQGKGHTLKTLEDIGILGGNLNDPYDLNEGRVIFALNNPNGQTVGFSARTLTKGENIPKYINSRETKLFIKSNTLYNYHLAKDLMAVQYVYLVEGFLDVIALDKAGIQSSLALMGTAFTKEQVALLKLLNKEVRVLLDSDIPGQMATLSVSKDLMAADIPFVLVKPNEEGLDPDDLLKKYGKEHLIAAINTFISKEDYIFNYYKSQNKRDDIEANKKFVNDIMYEVILNLRSRLEVSAFIERLSDASGFNGIVLTNMYERLRKNKETKESAIRVVETKLPLRQTLNKVTQAERFIIYQMLVYPEAREFFNTNVKVFTHEIHRYIANYIKEFAPNDEVNYASLLNDVNVRFSSDEAKIDEYTRELLEIEVEAEGVKYDQNILQDALMTLQYERELKLLEKDHEVALLNASTDAEYAAEKIKHLNKKRALLKKYERK